MADDECPTCGCPNRCNEAEIERLQAYVERLRNESAEMQIAIGVTRFRASEAQRIEDVIHPLNEVAQKRSDRMQAALVEANHA